MEFRLLKHFVDTNIISVDTEVKVRYNVLTLDKKHVTVIKDYFFIDEIIERENFYSFKLRNIRNNEIIYEISDNIIGIDGMTVGRFAAAFNFDLNGDPIITKKKTGRKPKQQLEEIA